MRGPPPGCRLTGFRRSVTLLGLGLVLAPCLLALSHTEHHLGSVVIIHTEASHPGAAAHLEQEEHRDGGICLACLHASHFYIRSTLATLLPSQEDGHSARPSARFVARTERPSASPRAPPL